MSAEVNPNVAAKLKEQAKAQPDATALVFPDRDGWASWTYGELDRRSDCYARGFLANGLRRGDRTLFLVKPSLEFYALVLGLLKIGAVPVVVDPGMGLRNVLACIEQIKPRGIVAISAVHVIRTVFRRPFRTVEVSITHGRRLFWGGPTTARCLLDGAPLESESFSPDDEAFIVFTSGSTGTPKGVSFRHGMFAGATRLMIDELGFGPGKCALETFAPFVLFHLAAGEKVVVPAMDLSKPVKADPRKLVHAIDAHRAETVFASPIVLRRILDHCRATHHRLDSVRLVLTGVAPIPGDLHRHLVPLLGEGARISVNYGATEALMCSSIDTAAVLGETWPMTARGAGNCVGLPYSGMQLEVIRITDDPIATWSDDLRVGAGEIGEIVARGPLVSPEYKDLPDANANAKIRDGAVILHRMGDLGYFDASGRLWFCGRKAHRLETEAGMVPNVPVEGIFNEHPAVRRSALVGTGPRGHQMPVLCVELEARVEPTPELGREIRALADGTRWQGVVEHILVHPGFPMDARHNSKIRNEDLVAWAEQRVGALVAASRAVA